MDVAYSESDHRTIAQLKRILEIVSEAAFTGVTTSFVQEHNHVFEFTDENKFVYSTLHEQYIELMEKTLLDFVQDVDIEELMGNLPAFMEKVGATNPAGTGSVIHFLLTLTEFETFKSMMLASKIEKTQAADAEEESTGSNAHDALDGLSKIDPVVVRRARQLLSLSKDSAAEWRFVSQKAGIFSIDATEASGEHYMRVKANIALSVEQTVAAHFTLTDPDLCKWDDVWQRVEVVAEKREGGVHDQLVKVFLKLPGVVRFIPGIPKFVHLRCCVERDAPRPGCVLVLLMAWDVEREAPDTGRMGVVRCVVLEPEGKRTRMLNLTRPPPVMPEWIASLFLTNTIMANMQASTERYKMLKGL